MRQAILITVAVALVGLAAGCGNPEGSSPADPVLDKATTGQDAQAKANLAVALTGAKLVYGQSQSFGANAADFAARLNGQGLGVKAQTTPSESADQVQVQGGGPQPLLLLAKSQSGNTAAIWDDGRGTTRYYVGGAAPAYGPQAPAAAGWTATP